MATLARLIVKLITDVSEFEAGMKNAAKKLDKIGTQMSQVGDKLTAGVTLPIIAAGTAAVKFASDLNETRNKTAVVFGSMSDDVMKFANSSNTALGMSENAALSYASTYGSILKNMGLTEEQTAEMSKALTTLTADYASFHNLAPEEAFEKIKAGLVGSSEPLISLGKDLRVASVQAYAMANGIGSANGKLTQQELALARYGTLIAQSGDEMGDFARTSDGLANSTRILGATIEDTLASFGEVAIPTVTTFLQALIPILDFFNNLPQPIKVGIVNMLLFAAAMGPILSIGGRVVSLGGQLMTFFGAKGGFASLSALLTTKLLPALIKLPGLLGTIGAGMGAISLPVLGLIAALALLVVTIVLFGKQAWETVQTIGKLFGLLPELIRQRTVPWMKNIGQQIVNGLTQGIASAWTSFVRWFSLLIIHLVEGIRNNLGVHSRSQVFFDIGKNLDLGLEEGIAALAHKPVNAMLNVATGTAQAPSAAPAGTGGGRSISIGPITINGDLSESAKESLKVEIMDLFTGVLEEALA